MSNGFPYNQILTTYSPSAGTYEGYTFAAAVWANGLTMVELQNGTDSSGTPGYSYQCVPGIDANGDSNTSLTFLVNTNNATQDPPYYFLCGSTAKHVILYSFTPQATPSDLTSDCISQMSTVITLDCPVASVMFYPPTGVLYVAGSNGDLSTWTVTFDSETGIPSVASINSTNVYDSAPNGQIQLFLVNTGSGSPYAVATGLCTSTQNGLVYFSADLQETGFLSDTPADTVAIAPAPNGLYAVTATTLQYYNAANIKTSQALADSFTAPWQTQVTAPSGTTFTSATFCAMPGVTDYPQGLLLIGGYIGSSDNSDENGVVYAYNPATGSSEELESSISGPVYGIIGDCVTHALYCNGSNGLGFLNLNPGADGALNTTLVVNTPTKSNGKGWLHILEDIAFAAIVVATTAVGAPEVAVEEVELDAGADAVVDESGYDADSEDNDDTDSEGGDDDDAPVNDAQLAQSQAVQAPPPVDGTPTDGVDAPMNDAQLAQSQVNQAQPPVDGTPTAGANNV
ncbi:hypothetical protein [Azospirillum cavernae]|uniref:hypothetical protein n=1 Tax=Azospirillum cavernae TaxID=2320860 RepID=UPI0011C3A23B|nr:hypothetical protein [Azospirillum cavernae]